MPYAAANIYISKNKPREENEKEIYCNNSQKNMHYNLKKYLKMFNFFPFKTKAAML